jgi:hypothetical protein
VDDLERALRDMLTDERLDVPLRSGATQMVHEGVRRRRRGRAIGATVSAVVAVAGAIVGAVVITGAGTQATQQPTPGQSPLSYDVPWTALAMPKTWSPPAISSTLPTLDAPACRADQLRAGQPAHNGATGHLFTIVPLRNVSLSTCKLIGSPQRVVARQAGRPDVVGTRGLQLGTGGVGGDLAPGHGGYLTVETDRDCPARYATPNRFPTRIYHSLAVTLPSGSTLTLAARLDVECGLRNGGLGVSVAQPRQPPDPRRVLLATLSAPESVRAGTMLRYVVTLTNPTATVVSLRHCPGYLQEASFADGSREKEPLGLNCATVHAVGPGESVRYEMRLAVPSTTTAGVVDVDWHLIVLSGPPPAQATIRVLPG